MANSQSQEETYDSLHYESDKDEAMDTSDSSGWDSDDEKESTESTESEYELGIDVIPPFSAHTSNGRMIYYVQWRWGDEERIRFTWESDWFFEAAKCRKPMVVFTGRQMFSRNNPTVSFIIANYLKKIPKAFFP